MSVNLEGREVDDKFIKDLMSSMKCSACGQCYQPSNIEVIGHQEDVWFLSVYCSSCSAHALVTAVIKTERESGKIGGFAEGSCSVSMDDVLDVHNLLSGLEGSISELLAAK